ncbi:hypothetical protein CHELA1G11_20984 [Hyphomicrobiales bacterium]|nr:hypothetical protein CHELA1G11_20984 [Hyphomicrobiales bacterium]CAH1692854.1 hypothetical protein CHELA1G2_21300 [Hyphomicrobiales bacterium]
MLIMVSKARSDEPSGHGFAWCALIGFNVAVLLNTMIFIALSWMIFSCLLRCLQSDSSLTRLILGL